LRPAVGRHLADLEPVRDDRAPGIALTNGRRRGADDPLVIGMGAELRGDARLIDQVEAEPRRGDTPAALGEEAPVETEGPERLLVLPQVERLRLGVDAVAGGGVEIE
jgi:hypothetical protein